MYQVCSLKWRILFHLLLIITSSDIFSQSEALNMQKYLFYRERFLGNGTDELPGFIKIGEDAGMSIPMSYRNKIHSSYIYIFNDQDPIDCPASIGCGSCAQDGLYGSGRQGVLHWGDATIRLGDYLALLGTEWKLLSDHNQALNETELEIYYALNAFNRLDEAAEAYYGKSSALDGFFIRDDVPEDFHTYFGNDYQIVNSAEVCKHSSDNDPDVNECTDAADPDLIVPSAMSQDQVIGMLFGLRAITEFVSGSVTVNGVNLKQEAIDITTRMVNYVKKESGLNAWVILDPNGDPVCRGPLAVGFCYGIAQTANKITDGNFHNFFSLTSGLVAWDFLEVNFSQSGSPICIPPVVPVHYCFNWNSFNTTMILKLASSGNSWSPTNIGKNVAYTGQYLYDLANAAYNDADVYHSKSHYENILNTAPCVGPCFDNGYGLYAGSDCSPTAGWTAKDRWHDPEDANQTQDPNEIDHFDYGEYNGLDYMLAYNFYRIAFADEIDEPYAKDWTISGNISGYQRYSAYNKITSGAYIASGADVQMRAGEEIILEGEFTAEAGSEFMAFIEPYQCNPANTFKTEIAFTPAELDEKDNISFSDTSLLSRLAGIIYPVPANKSTNIYITVNSEETLTVRILNIQGSEIQSIINQTNYDAGIVQIELKTIDMISGVYFCLISSTQETIIKKFSVQHDF